MKMKVEIPKGYEIDKEKSTFECIVFKKVDSKPKNWLDLESISGYYINNYSILINLTNPVVTTGHENIFPTKQDAESVLALAQLLQLRKAWIGDWKADFLNNKLKFCVFREYNKISINSFPYWFNELSFPTRDMAEEFLNTFEALIKVYYKLV